MSSASQPPYPAGFGAHRRSSPFLDLIGPLYSRGSGLDLRLALRVDQKHLNNGGTVHGGVLAALADVAIGYAIATIDDPPTPLTTTSLTINLSGAARPGDLLTSRASLQHQGSRVVIGHCVLEVDERSIAQASAVFVPGSTAVRPPALADGTLPATAETQYGSDRR